MPMTWPTCPAWSATASPGAQIWQAGAAVVLAVAAPAGHPGPRRDPQLDFGYGLLMLRSAKPIMLSLDPWTNRPDARHQRRPARHRASHQGHRRGPMGPLMRNPRPGLAWSRRRLAANLAIYGIYMDSPEWYRRRELWLDEWRAAHGGGDPYCLVCGAEWTLRHGDLHHRTYERLGGEHSSDLAPLCRSHHRCLHALMESTPAWWRLSRAQATDLIVAYLRDQHPQEGEHE